MTPVVEMMIWVVLVTSLVLVKIWFERHGLGWTRLTPSSSVHTATCDPGDSGVELEEVSSGVVTSHWLVFRKMFGHG